MSIINFDARKGKLRERIRILSENIRKGKKYSHYQDFIERGSAYKKLREYENAVKDFSFVLSLNKSIVKKEDAFITLSKRGGSYIKMGRVEDARRDFMFKCKMMPRCPNSYEDLGFFYSMIKEHQNVIDVCTSLLSWEKSAYAHYLRGVAFFNTGRLGFSLKDLTVALNMQMNMQDEDERMTGDMFLARGRTFGEIGKLEHAISNFNSAMEKYYRLRNSIEKSNLEEDFLHLAYCYRGEVYMYQKKFKDAIYDFSKGIELDPESSDTSSNYKICFEKTEEARKRLFQESQNNEWNNINNMQIVVVVDSQEEEEMFSGNNNSEEYNNNSQIALVEEEEEYNFSGSYYDDEEEDEGENDKKWICLSDERERRGW